jgi:hypothetical protein
VIGLGGTGKTVLLSLKKMISENSPNGLNDFPFLRFISFDTDLHIQEMKSSIKSLNEDELTLDPVREFFPLGSSWNNRPQLEKFPEIQEWFPQSYVNKLATTDFRIGAGQCKPLGRFSLAWKPNEAYDKLSAQMSSIITISNQGKVALNQIDNGLNVFICGSLCGGTSAGTFIDFAYMVRHIATGMNVDLSLYGMFALSSLFAGIVNGEHNIKMNCYASLVELDYFMTSSNYDNPLRNYRPGFHNYGHIALYDKVAMNRVFDFPFLFDRANEKNISLGGAGDLAEMIARFIYLQTGSEAAQAYLSVDSNITSNHDQRYLNHLGKPIRYRTMGTYSIVFPKRMVRQLLGYILTKEILTILLDDTYPTSMVKNISERFLKDKKFHTQGNLRERITSFIPGGQTPVSWLDHVQAELDTFISGEDGLNKLPVKDWATRIKDFLSGIDRDFEEYKGQNIVATRKAAEVFSTDLERFLNGMLDLRLKNDIANEKQMSRGSLRRICDILEVMQLDFNAAKKRFKDTQHQVSVTVKDRRAEVENLRQELSGMTKGVFGVKGKAKKLLAEIGKAMVDYQAARQEEFISEHLFELLDGQRDHIKDIPGIVDVVEGRLRTFEIMKKNMMDNLPEVNAMLSQNRSYKSGDLVLALFQFDRDVVDTFDRIWDDPETGKEYILAKIGDQLREETVFGFLYRRAETLSADTMLRRLLKISESIFSDSVENINIEDLILGDKNILNGFIGKNFHGNANLFLGIDNTTMAYEGIDRQQNQFYAVTIPGAKYKGGGLPCSRQKGDLSNQERKCPVDADTTNTIVCPHHRNCLKQVILPTLDNKTALIETENNGEVNFIKTLVGYPLYSIATAAICQGEYDRQRELDRNSGKIGETVHMFGELHFPKLGERTEDVLERKKRFKENLLLGTALGVVKLLPLSVDFYTEEDNQFQREDPSLHLGDGFEDALNRSQSNRTIDVENVDLFFCDLKHYIGRLLDEPQQKQKAGEKLEDAFWQIMRREKNTEGSIFTPEDAKYIVEFLKYNFGKDLNPPKVGVIR